MKLFIYCAGGFGVEMMDVAWRINAHAHRWDELLFIDDVQMVSERYGRPLKKFEEVKDTYPVESFEVAIANGEPESRQKLYDKIAECGMASATLIDPTSTVSPSARIGRGVSIMANAFISSLAVLGNNAAINVGAMVGHDTAIGAHSVLSSAANVGGYCTVGEKTYIGMGSQIRDRSVVGASVIVGMGSIVYQDVPDRVIVLGNPARPVKANADGKIFK